MNNNKSRVQRTPMPCLHIAFKGPKHYCAESLICRVWRIQSSAPTLPLCASDAQCGSQTLSRTRALNLAEQTHMTLATLFAEKHIEAFGSFASSRNQRHDIAVGNIASPQVEKRRRQNKKKQSIQHVGTEVLPSGSQETMYVWRQSANQVVIRIAVRAGVRVAQFVCEVDDGSTCLEIKRGTPVKKCSVLAKVKPELSAWL